MNDTQASPHGQSANCGVVFPDIFFEHLDSEEIPWIMDQVGHPCLNLNGFAKVFGYSEDYMKKLPVSQRPQPFPREGFYRYGEFLEAWHRAKVDI